jgi:hypothetical protein
MIVWMLQNTRVVEPEGETIQILLRSKASPHPAPCSFSPALLMSASAAIADPLRLRVKRRS